MARVVKPTRASDISSALNDRAAYAATSDRMPSRVPNSKVFRGDCYRKRTMQLVRRIADVSSALQGGCEELLLETRFGALA